MTVLDRFVASPADARAVMTVLGRFVASPADAGPS